jgi:two-component system chemotaxis sensor kinase CheA
MADPLKYFRVEAREIVEQLERALLELERGQAPAETVAHVLRWAHTLKGAARVVKQLEIASRAHRLEDLLQPFRESPRVPVAAEQDALLAELDAIRRQVAELQLPARAASPGTPAAPTSAAATSQVEKAIASAPEELRLAAAPLEHVESLMDGVAELGFQLGTARYALPRLSQSRSLAEQLTERLDPRRNALGSPTALVALRALAGELEAKLAKVERELSTGLERSARELGQVRDRVDQLRLVAASSMFGTLERATRDVAVSLGKQALFEAQGGDVRLDADVLSAVQRALLQAVRNAVAHGIEPSPERQAGGKPAAGRVTLQVQRHGKQVSFVCRDDGRGVDLHGVEREAQRLGKLTATGSADPRTLLGLLLEGGISTSGEVSQHAGRGVGLDLIREALTSVGGKVQLRSEPGRGTSLELSVPATLSALEALIVETAERAYAIPMAGVVQAMRFELSALSRSAEGDTLSFEGQVVPFVPLASLLRESAPQEQKRRAWSAVIVRGESGMLALGVETLLGNESMVARALPDSVEVDPAVAGVTLDQDGNPRLLLDPDGLLEAAARAPHEPATPAAVRRRILVVDDSLTTRMLEQSILESAGYEVTLATSGEQGLELARERRPDLLLVDVEMPGMDGFEVLRRLRADPQLATLPAILVTSRASPADVVRGREAGASGHIDKGEFDQLAFLEQIGRLVR